MSVAQKLKNITFAEFVLYFSLFFVGIFHTYLSCILSAILIIRLVLLASKHGSLKINLNITLIALIVMLVFYALTTFWAVDKGQAILGFFKFMPLPLYALLLMQEEELKEKTLTGLPYVAAVMTVLSAFCMLIPFSEQYFNVDGRMAGFLQYPNTFAIVLLVSALLLITKEKLNIWDYVSIAVLLLGIIFTGSRAVFVLTGGSVILALLINKNKRIRWITLLVITVGIIAVVGYCFITNNFEVLSRYLSISLTEDTFVGRILYAYDALPIILKNPFGLGYMGYYLMQQSFQSGVYGVMFIHNDFLQILLDVGWIPFVLFAAAIVMTLFNRNVPLGRKLVICVLLAHTAFDFNLQYVAVFMILVLFLNTKDYKAFSIKYRRLSFVGVTAVLLSLCTFFGVVHGLIRFQLYDAAKTLYPHDIFTDIAQLKETEDPYEANLIADRMLKRNTYFPLPYSVKARYAYSQGDFADVIRYKNKAIELAPFSHSEYWEYGYMLVTGIQLYENAGDTKSAEICKKELLSLEDKLSSLENRMSKFGASIHDQPVLSFPDDLNEYIEELKNSK